MCVNILLLSLRFDSSRDTARKWGKDSVFSFWKPLLAGESERQRRSIVIEICGSEWKDIWTYNVFPVEMGHEFFLEFMSPPANCVIFAEPTAAGTPYHTLPDQEISIALKFYNFLFFCECIVVIQFEKKLMLVNSRRTNQRWCSQKIGRHEAPSCQCGKL